MNFQVIPQKYESNKDSIEGEVLKNSYSKFTFKYINFFNLYENADITNKNAIINQFEHFLLNYLSIFKLLFYHKNKCANINKKDQNYNEIFDIVICVEHQCIIIEEIDFKIFTKVINYLKEQQKIIVNVTVDDKNEEENDIKQIKEEIHNFCQNQLEIKSNEFVSKTFQSVIGFLIRRYFYPTEFFQDKSFFDFDLQHNYNERLIRSEFIDLVDSKSLQHKNLLQMKEKIKRNQIEIHLTDFEEEDFIILRTIYFNIKYHFYLVIHKETLYVFLMKKIIYPNEITKEMKHEKYFDENYSHHCLCHFYGFLKNKDKTIGFIYEFMCNGSLKSYVTSNRSKIDETFSLRTINRIFQGIEYLHSRCLIYRDLKPSNILLDHDFIPYISDFETIRQLNDDAENGQENFTNDIGSLIYASPEQYKGKMISYSTDIYSFGLIIYFLYESDDMMKFISKNNDYAIQFQSNISDNLQKVIINCIKIKQEERMDHREIKSVLIEETRSLIHQEIISFKEKQRMNGFLYESFVLEIENTNKFNKFISFIFTLKEEESKSDALVKMGDIYYYGEVVEQDYLKAKKFYELSAELNNSTALFKLGSMYENGLGIERDYLKAKEYYELSIQQNNTKALINLGNLYENGLGVEQNYSKAKELYELSSNQNNSNAFIFLGNLYYFGCGVTRNYSKTKEYYELSKKFDNSYAFNHLGYLYLKGIGVGKDYLKAKNYFERSAKMNNSYALYNLGSIFLKGFDVEKNYAKAKEYFEQSANLNNSDALIKIGNLYLKGTGVEKDFLKAKRYYELSANQNNPDALFKIGNLYLKGNGVKPDHFKAIQYFELAFKNKNLDSLFFLAIMYSSGEFFNVDYSKSIHYFLQSTAIKYEKIRVVNKIDNFPYYKWVNNHYYYHSNNDLGLIYFTVFEDIEKATHFIKLAAFGEYPYGQNNYGLLNEFYFNQYENAEYMYCKSLKHQFALSAFNLARLKEKAGKIMESIEFYIKASNFEDEPLIFRNRQHYDKRLEISKTFIICLANLILSDFYFSQANYDESRKYFIKSLAKLTANEIRFKTIKRNVQSIFIYLRHFILNYPTFNLINQPSISNDNKVKHILNESKYLFENITANETFQRVVMNKKFHCKNDIKVDNEKINKYSGSNEIVSNINKDKMKIPFNFNRIENMLYSNQKNEEEIIFEKSSEIFDFFIKNRKTKEIFNTEIRKIIKIMNLIIYKPPYHILFGRINIQTQKPKQSIHMNPNAKEINQSFYDAFFE